MASAPLVSVIIPVYNPGPYLQQCLASVCGQTLQDLEIICVDDGSTGGSQALLKAFAARDPRIVLVSHKKNRGCAAARNSGMDRASGKYISFLDSDDWIDAAYLEELVCAAEAEQLPLVLNSNIIQENEDGTKVRFEPGSYDETIGFSTTGYVECGSNIGNFTYSNCCCLYRRDYLEKLGVRFPEGLDYTDNFFHIATFLPQEKIYITNTNAYHYMQHPDSICGKAVQEVEKYDIFYVYKYIYEYYKDNDFLETRKINFFELTKYFSRFSNKSLMFQHLFSVYSLMRDAVERHPSFYSLEEWLFFKAILRSRRYLFYEHIVSPQDSRLSKYILDMREHAKRDLPEKAQRHKQELKKRRMLRGLRNTVAAKMPGRK